MLPKKLLIILIVIVIAILGVGIWLGVKFLGPKNPAGPSEFSAVYLATGDIYFGKLDWFPWPRMTNVWFLQRSINQQNQPQLGVAPFSSAFWRPIDEIYLNPKQIIFWTNLRNDSQLAQALANPTALQSLQSPAQPQPQPQPSASTSTFQGPSGPPPFGK
jgi:hypothetical protein